MGKTGGEVVWEWHLWDHLIQDADKDKANFGDVGAHPERVDINYNVVAGQRANPDWTHFNAVAYNAELDQVVVSLRNFSEIWILDHGTTTREAGGHTGGKTRQRRRPPVSLGKPASLSSRNDPGSAAIRPAQCSLDSQWSRGCRSPFDFQ